MPCRTVATKTGGEIHRAAKKRPFALRHESNKKKQKGTHRARPRPKKLPTAFKQKDVVLSSKMGESVLQQQSNLEKQTKLINQEAERKKIAERWTRGGRQQAWVPRREGEVRLSWVVSKTGTIGRTGWPRGKPTKSGVWTQRSKKVHGSAGGFKGSRREMGLP